MLEHGAYTLLIHSCYDRERFPTLEDAFDWCWARTDEEMNAVKFVLGKFFVLSNGVYVQNRIQEEIDKYHQNSSINSKIAIDREEKRRLAKARIVHEACSSVNEPPPNQEPRTIEPLTKNHKPRTINQEPLTTKPKSDSKESSLKPLSGVVAKSDIPPAEKIKPGEPITRETWKFYSEAYFLRYGAEPVRNATVTGQLAQFVKRIGKEESPYVAAFFVHHNNQFYVQKMHTVGLLLADAEKLRTEWATKRTVTNTQARQVDRKQNTANVFNQLIDEQREAKSGKN